MIRLDCSKFNDRYICKITGDIKKDAKSLNIIQITLHNLGFEYCEDKLLCNNSNKNRKLIGFSTEKERLLEFRVEYEKIKSKLRREKG